jgi:hypothetical protein
LGRAFFGNGLCFRPSIPDDNNDVLNAPLCRLVNFGHAAVGYATFGYVIRISHVLDRPHHRRQSPWQDAFFPIRGEAAFAGFHVVPSRSG